MRQQQGSMVSHHHRHHSWSGQCCQQQHECCRLDAVHTLFHWKRHSSQQSLHCKPSWAWLTRKEASFADCWKYAKGHMFTIGKKLQGGGVWLQGVQDSVIYGTTPKENPQSWLGAKGFCYSEDKYHGRVLFTREQLILACWSEVYYVHHRNIIMMTTKWVYNIEQFLVLILLLIWKFNSIFLWFGCITKSHWHHSLDPQAFQLWHYSDATSSS